MRILVVGAGATGGYFGGRLMQAGRDVTFLVRPERAEQLRRDGLRIVSPHGDLTLSPKLLTADQITQPFDAVLLSVKAYALDSALADLAPAVGPQTMIMPMLNGMRHIDRLIERFGDDRVLGGVCVVATTLDSDGRVLQLNEMQELTYGERSGEDSARIRALDAEMQGAGFKARASTHILSDMWEKWVFLATMAAVTCTMQGTIGEIEAAPGGTSFTLQCLAESIAIATAAGFPPREVFVERTKTLLTTAGSSFSSSMYRDMQQSAPIEADHIIGDLLDRARKMDVSAPLLTIVYTHLSIYQNRLR
jgi:2-dehydropantoate 2-reductase